MFPNQRRFITALLFVLVVAATATGWSQVKRVTRPLRRPPRDYREPRSFPSLKWRVDLGMRPHTAPAVADLDLDGRPDLIIPAADDYVYRLTSIGEPVWRQKLPAPITAGVTLGDADRDGTLDLLLAAGKTLVCLDPDGKTQWTYELPEIIRSQCTIADLDSDGQPEIIFGCNDNKLHVLTGDGKPKWTFETKSWIVGGVACADLDGDGRLEVVFGSLDYDIYCLDATGQERWRFSTENWVQSSPCIADVDRDGRLDIVAVSDDGQIYCLSDQGKLKWQERITAEGENRAYLAVADLDGDRTVETIVTTPNGQVMVFTGVGDRAWTASVGAGVAASPLVADLNGNGWQDILVVTESGRMVAFNTWGVTLWSAYLGHSIHATPVLTDINRNKKLEIWVANLVSLEGSSGFFSRYEISQPGGAIKWGAMKGDPYRTGYVANGSNYGKTWTRGGDYATAWEPFQAGYRPRTGLSAPRRILINTLPLIDGPPGNGDGALDPGETAILRVQVSNRGRGPSYDSLLRLKAENAPLLLDRTSMYLGWVAPGATKTVIFRVTHPRLDRRRRPSRGGPATLRMTVLESGVVAGGSVLRIEKPPTLHPVLRIARHQILDQPGTHTFGNGNGRLDSGETVILRILLQNDTVTTAEVAEVTVHSPSDDVLVATPSVTVKGVVPKGGRHAEFSLRVARTVKKRSIVLRIVTRPTGAPSHSETLRFTIGAFPVDKQPPTIKMITPRSKIGYMKRERAVITGIVSDRSNIASFRFQGQVVPIKTLTAAGPNRYRFKFIRNLKIGENVFPIVATDGIGNSVTQWVRIIRLP